MYNWDTIIETKKYKKINGTTFVTVVRHNWSFFVGYNCVSEVDKLSFWEGFCHPIGALGFVVRPDEFELSVTTFEVVSKEMVCNVNMSCELGCRVIIFQVDARFVVLIDGNWAAHELTRNVFEHVHDPQYHLDDV